MSLVLFFFFHFFVLFLPRLPIRVFSLANYSSFFFVFREFLVIIFKVCVPFMIILHEKENKVYGVREMEMKIDLSNFMHARLDGYFKRNNNKQNFISLLNPLI